MTDISEIVSLIEKQGAQWTEFKKANDSRIETLEELARETKNFMCEVTSPDFSSGTKLNKTLAPDSESFSVKLSDGKVVPVLTKSASCSDFFPKDKGQDAFNIGSYVLDVMTGRKAASSSALVPTGVSSVVIDNVRAQASIIQAGAGTIVIDGPTNLAKITGDPMVYEHTEAASDVSESDITLSPVALNPKAGRIPNFV